MNETDPQAKASATVPDSFKTSLAYLRTFSPRLTVLLLLLAVLNITMRTLPSLMDAYMDWERRQPVSGGGLNSPWDVFFLVFGLWFALAGPMTFLLGLCFSGFLSAPFTALSYILLQRHAEKNAAPESASPPTTKRVFFQLFFLFFLLDWQRGAEILRALAQVPLSWTNLLFVVPILSLLWTPLPYLLFQRQANPVKKAWRAWRDSPAYWLATFALIQGAYWAMSWLYFPLLGIYLLKSGLNSFILESIRCLLFIPCALFYLARCQAWFSSQPQESPV